MHGLPAVGKHPPQLHGHAHFDDLTVQAVVNQPIVVQGVSQMATTHPSNNNPKIRNPSPDFLVWNHSFENPFDDRRHPVSRLIEAEVSGDPVEVVHLGNGIQQKHGLTTLKIKKKTSRRCQHYASTHSPSPAPSRASPSAAKTPTCLSCRRC